MTSSLVGSEMCIRDRSWVGRDVNSAAKLRGQMIGPSELQLRKVTNGNVTVSYTHLTLPTICSV
eukprot:4278779-Prorocentrum_lima.AAC.1